VCQLWVVVFLWLDETETGQFLAWSFVLLVTTHCCTQKTFKNTESKWQVKYTDIVRDPRRPDFGETVPSLRAVFCVPPGYMAGHEFVQLSKLLVRNITTFLSAHIALSFSTYNFALISDTTIVKSNITRLVCCVFVVNRRRSEVRGRGGLNAEVRNKSFCLCRGSNLDRPVVQSVARNYTDWATLTS
jgi:hypothetical protein